MKTFYVMLNYHVYMVFATDPLAISPYLTQLLAILLMARKLLHIFVVLAALVMSVIYTQLHTKDAYVFYGDALGYYAYLPSAFIYHNLKGLDQFPEDRGVAEGIMHNIHNMGKGSVTTEKGYKLNQYTYGVALMELPFFLGAHVYEKAAGLPANGFSPTYAIAIKISAMFFVLMGFYFIWKVLRRYFDPTVSLLTIALLYLATNLFWFSLHQAGMSHQPVFMLYALLMHLTIRLHDTPKRWLFLATGFVMGMIIVIRPTDIFCAGIPLFYGVYNKDTLLAKLDLLKMNIGNIIAMVAVAAIPAIPQLLFWKELTGHWIYYSYGSQPFFWKHPKLIEGLFFFKNGFFAYCPVFFFGVLGMLWFRRDELKEWALPIAVIFPIYSYVIYSWYCYNYINGLGSRPMIHLYPLFAVPLAMFLHIIAKRKLLKAAVATIVVFFISVNYSFSALKAHWLLNSEEANMHYCAQMLYRNDINYNDLVVFDLPEFQPDTNKITKVADLYTEHFSDSLDANYEPEIETGAKYVYRLPKDMEYLPKPIKLKYSKAVFKDAEWFKCSGRFRFHEWPEYRSHLLTLIVKRADGDLMKWAGVNIDNKVGILPPRCLHKPEEITFYHFENDRWGNVHYFARVPKGMKDGDDVELGIWNLSKSEMFVDSIKLELYK